jgi:fused signal recognition particle receptor
MSDKDKQGLIGRLFSRKNSADEPEKPSEPESQDNGKDNLVEEPAVAAEFSPEVQGVAAGNREAPAVEEITGLELEEPEKTPGNEPGPENRESAGLFSRLKKGLSKTRQRFVGTLDGLFYGKKQIDEEFLEQLEEILLTSDLGVQTSYRLFAEVEEKVSHQALEDPEHLRSFLQQEIQKILQGAEQPWEIKAKPYVIMAVGVNGVGKTTTIGKLAAIFTAQGKEVLLGAADTFRAAAIEQLEIWSERAGVPLIRQKMGADPAAVSFDTVQSAVSRGVDVAIIDTAGRLHTKVNLMDELKKMKRVISKALPGAPHEILLVLDANTGQNAINQARMFHEALGITGLVMTKLDGTAKGGVIVGVCDELKLPVRYIGIGEQLDDLRPFKADDFVNALFDRV